MKGCRRQLKLRQFMIFSCCHIWWRVNETHSNKNSIQYTLIYWFWLLSYVVYILTLSLFKDILFEQKSLRNSGEFTLAMLKDFKLLSALPHNSPVHTDMACLFLFTNINNKKFGMAKFGHFNNSSLKKVIEPIEKKENGIYNI